MGFVPELDRIVLVLLTDNCLVLLFYRVQINY